MKFVPILLCVALVACSTDSAGPKTGPGTDVDATVAVGDAGASSGGSSGSSSGGSSGSSSGVATGSSSGSSSGVSGSSSGAASGSGSGGSEAGADANTEAGSDTGPSGGDGSVAGGQTGAVWTNRYDNARTGATLTETVLTPATVGLAGKFGLLFSMPVDGTVQAQPLYVPGVPIKGSVHNTVFAATEHNTVYAYDADAAGPALWTQSLGASAPSSGSVYGCTDLYPEIGVNSTPVIDTASGTIYVAAKTLEGGNRHHRLHALDITTGAERTGSPADIAPAGFDPFIEQNRPGLLLEGGVVYVAFASHCDGANYHGWVVAFDAKTLALRAAFNDTPTGNQGGIWQSGMGLSADATGVYFVAGNGTFDTSGNHANTGSSVGRLTLGNSGLAVADFYTPYNSASLNASDSDLASGAVLGVGTNYLYVGGKDSHLRVLDRSNLGGFHAAGDQIAQDVSLGGGHLHGGPVFWNGSKPTLFAWPESQLLLGYALNAGKLSTPPATGNIGYKPVHPGGMITVSSNGSTPKTGILWAAVVSASAPADIAWHGITAGKLYALDAENLATILWNSDQNAARDSLGLFAKFCPPMVANGRVYMGTATNTNMVQVYGRLP